MCSKIPFKSKKDAKAHFKQSATSKKAKSHRVKLRFYKCRECGNYHGTSYTKKKNKSVAKDKKDNGYDVVREAESLVRKRWLENKAKEITIEVLSKIL